MEIQTMYFIYALICPDCQKVKYVGVTLDPRSRLQQHIVDTETRSRKFKWLKRLKVKKKRPILKIIDMVTEDKRFIFEQHYIQICIQRGDIIYNRATEKTKIKTKNKNKAEPEYKRKRDRKKNKNNTGVHYDNTRQRYVVQIRINGKQKKIGVFKTEQEARIKYINSIENIGIITEL